MLSARELNDLESRTRTSSAGRVGAELRTNSADLQQRIIANYRGRPIHADNTYVLLPYKAC